MTTSKPIKLPEELYNRFLEIHEQEKPVETAPFWHTFERLLAEHEER